MFIAVCGILNVAKAYQIFYTTHSDWEGERGEGRA